MCVGAPLPTGGWADDRKRGSAKPQRKVRMLYVEKVYYNLLTIY